MNEMQNNSRVSFGSAEEAHFIFEAMGQPIVQITTLEYPDNPNWCDFTFEPLQRGYGTTLGNTLRRVLLASIPGAAVCYCRFDDGPSHEYTTIPGVLEDVTEIMLNLKSMPVKLLGQETNATLRLEVTGLKGGDTYEVKASDIQANADVEVLDPDHHIATITDQKTSLNMEIGVRRGFGYMQFDDHRPQDMNPRWASKTAMPVGVIPIDSKFSPVISANFRVEPTRVGQDTSFDKLILTLKTNGGIAPEEALRHANRIMRSYLFHVEMFCSGGVPESFEPVKGPSDDILDKPLAFLELSIRPSKCLENIGVETIRDLLNWDVKNLLELRNFGEKSLAEIQEKLTRYSLNLTDSRGEKN